MKKRPTTVARTAGVDVHQFTSLGLVVKLAMIVGWAAAIILFIVGSFGGHLVLSLVSVLCFSGLLFVESSATSGSQRTGVVQRENPGREPQSVDHRQLKVPADARIAEVARAVLASCQPDFVVVQGESVVGVVTRSDVIWALVQGAGDAAIVAITRRDVPRVDADMSFDEVGRMMAEKNTPMVAVFDGESYLGLVKHSDIAEAMKLLRTSTGSRKPSITPTMLTRKAWT